MRALHASLARAGVTGPAASHYLGEVRKTVRTIIMSTNSRSSFGRIVTLLGDAIAAASAVSHGRQPQAANLRGLGIDPDQFRSIRQG